MKTFPFLDKHLSRKKNINAANIARSKYIQSIYQVPTSFLDRYAICQKFIKCVFKDHDRLSL